MSADPRIAQIIAEMRELLPNARPEQQARILEMMTACLIKNKKTQPENSDYLDER